MNIFGYKILVVKDTKKQKVNWIDRAFELYKKEPRLGLGNVTIQINHEFDLQLNIKTVSNGLWRKFHSEMQVIRSDLQTNGSVTQR